MIYLRFIYSVLIPLLAFYYVLICAHVLGVCKVTNRKVTFLKALIPFYYLIVSQNKKNKNVK